MYHNLTDFRLCICVIVCLLRMSELKTRAFIIFRMLILVLEHDIKRV